jgi:hypothetical protein
LQRVVSRTSRLIASKTAALPEYGIMDIPGDHQIIDDHPECFAFIGYLIFLLH